MSRIHTSLLLLLCAVAVTKQQGPQATGTGNHGGFRPVNPGGRFQPQLPGSMPQHTPTAFLPLPTNAFPRQIFPIKPVPPSPGQPPVQQPPVQQPPVQQPPVQQPPAHQPPVHQPQPPAHQPPVHQPPVQQPPVQQPPVQQPPAHQPPAHQPQPPAHQPPVQQPPVQQPTFEQPPVQQPPVQQPPAQQPPPHQPPPHQPQSQPNNQPFQPPMGFETLPLPFLPHDPHSPNPLPPVTNILHPSPNTLPPVNPMTNPGFQNSSMPSFPTQPNEGQQTNQNPTHNTNPNPPVQMPPSSQPSNPPSDTNQPTNTMPPNPQQPQIPPVPMPPNNQLPTQNQPPNNNNMLPPINPHQQPNNPSGLPTPQNQLPNPTHGNLNPMGSTLPNSNQPQQPHQNPQNQPSIPQPNAQQPHQHPHQPSFPQPNNPPQPTQPQSQPPSQPSQPQSPQPQPPQALPNHLPGPTQQLPNPMPSAEAPGTSHVDPPPNLTPGAVHAAAVEVLVNQMITAVDSLQTGFTQAMQTVSRDQQNAIATLESQLNSVKNQVANISSTPVAPVETGPHPAVLTALQELSSMVNTVQVNLTSVAMDIAAVRSEALAAQQQSNARLVALENAATSTASQSSQQVQANTAQIRELTKALWSVNTAPRILKDCDNAMYSGIWIFSLVPGVRFEAVCDQITTPGGWMIIQRRTDGTENFFRNWNDYSQGFGQPQGEYWLGNENLHLLTRTGKWMLRIEITDFNDTVGVGTYEDFKIGTALDGYRLSIGMFRGTIGNALNHHHLQQFSTFDRDNDSALEHNCAQFYKGGWWYEACYDSNLNGPYQTATYTGHDSIRWHGWGTGPPVSLKSTKMMIRRMVPTLQ